MTEDNQQQIEYVKAKPEHLPKANILAIFSGDGIDVYGLGIINYLVNFCSRFNCIYNIIDWLDK